ncbi:MAG: uracil-DNA glycosylase, partial [Candidatus Brocadiae bacterium]|nr:uracil-DNA glycosylase [Candidatus Brocadiia bacterium]
PGFGDPAAALVLVGLAPGAHGSNRTGRMFTGDASGDFLYPALHRAGLASSPDARSRDDGLVLHGVWITAAARCAPPGNKPTPRELETCRPWLERELLLLPGVRAFLAIGRIGHEALLRLAGAPLAAHPFAHGAVHEIPGLAPIVDTYHVSRQNTNTGRLTAAMFDAALATAAQRAGLAPRLSPPVPPPPASSSRSRGGNPRRTPSPGRA